MKTNGKQRQKAAVKRTSAEIRREIGQTRHEMDETLDELYQRLHPVHLLNDVLGYASRPENRRRARTAASKGRWQAERARANAAHKMHQARHAARRSGRRAGRRARSMAELLWHEVRDNPLPVLLVGAGIGWYVWRRSRRRTAYLDIDLILVEEDLSQASYGSNVAGSDRARSASSPSKVVARTGLATSLDQGDLQRERADVGAYRRDRSSRYQPRGVERPGELPGY